MTWDTRRPIWGRLPAKGYQDSPVEDWLTAWADEELSAKLAQMESWYTQLHPDTCDPASLDYLAYLVGFSGPYWDTQWQETPKRALVRDSHWLWANRGTLKAIARVLNIHQVQHDLWLSGVLRLSFGLPGRFGTPSPRVYLRLPKQYPRAGAAFGEAERTRRNWVPAVIRSKVTYERFYLGFSRVGDPLF